MKDNVCVIVGAGDFCETKIEKGNMIIAADGGYEKLKKIGVSPDFFIGDADSLGYIPENIQKIILPTVKGDTDVLAAIRIGLDKGMRKFVIYGALGGSRFSHSYANLQLLAFLKEYCADGVLISGGIKVRLLENEVFEITDNCKYFSLFSYSEKCIAEISGAKYNGKYEFSNCFPLGVSNEITGNTTIKISLGQAILITEEE